MELTFTKSKETKGAYQYRQADTADGSRPEVGSLYLTKQAAEAIGNPETLTVAIAAA